MTIDQTSSWTSRGETPSGACVTKAWGRGAEVGQGRARAEMVRVSPGQVEGLEPSRVWAQGQAGGAQIWALVCALRQDPPPPATSVSLL